VTPAGHVFFHSVPHPEGDHPPDLPDTGFDCPPGAVSHVPNAKNHVSNVKKFPVVAGSEHVSLRSHWIDDPDPRWPPAPERGEE